MHPVGKTKPDAMNGNNVVHMVSVIPLILVMRSASVVEDVASFRASDAAMMPPAVRHLYRYGKSACAWPPCPVASRHAAYPRTSVVSSGWMASDTPRCPHLPGRGTYVPTRKEDQPVTVGPWSPCPWVHVPELVRHRCENTRGCSRIA